MALVLSQLLSRSVSPLPPRISSSARDSSAGAMAGDASVRARSGCCRSPWWRPAVYQPIPCPSISLMLWFVVAAFFFPCLPWLVAGAWGLMARWFAICGGGEPAAVCCRCLLLCFIFPGVEVTRGRCGTAVSNGVKQRWSSETINHGTASATKIFSPTQEAIWWQSNTPASSGALSTSFVRPLQRFVAAFNVPSSASGFVPAVMVDGCVRCLSLNGGSREDGPDCFDLNLFGVLFPKCGDFCVICLFSEVPSKSWW